MRFVEPITVRLRNSISQAKALWPENRRALIKPPVIGYTMLTAHRTQIISGMLILLMVFIAPVVSDYIARTLFPPETAKKVFGLIKTQSESPIKAVFETTLLAILWLGSILQILYRIWFEIPDGVRRANRRAAELMAEADQLSQSTERTKKLNHALALTSDMQLEAQLRSRLRSAPESAQGASQSNAPIVEADDKTMIDSLSAESASETDSPGTSLEDRYLVAAELGRGAMGVVYEANDSVLDRKVALKQLSVVLSGDEEHASRFRREAKALAKLTHPNVVQVYDLIEEGGRLWMVLEYVEGGDLASFAKDRGQLTIEDAARIIIPVAEGLAYAHSQGIIHRDLKPANILLSRKLTPKISDFGIAKLSQGGSLTQVGTVMGSPPYMSPEQCSGDPTDSRTDIYSLGITLYELLSGTVPFKGETGAVLAKHITEQPQPLSEVLDTIPHEAEELIRRMLAKKADDRPADMKQVIESLSVFKSAESESKRLRPVSV